MHYDGMPKECPDPVFIVGSSRSGTTWIQSLLCISDGFFSCPETKFFQQTLDPHGVLSHYQAYPIKTKPIPPEIGPGLLERTFEHMDREGSVRLPDKARDALRRLAREGHLGPAQYLNILMYALGGDPAKVAVRWIEKTPRHILFLDAIFHYFPDSKVVCVYRDPVGVMLSAYNNFKVPFLESLKDLMSLYAEFERFMADNPSRAKQVIAIRYEDLKKDVSKANDVLRFLGSGPIDPAILTDKCAESFLNIYGGTKMASIQPQMARKEGAGGSPEDEKEKRLLQRICRIFRKKASPGVVGYISSYPEFAFSDYLKEGFPLFFLRESVRYFVFHARMAASYAKAVFAKGV